MKNKVFRRVAALVLILSLLPSSAFALVFGSQLGSAGYEIAAGTTLSGGVYWDGSDYIRDNYISYTPNSSVTPVVVYGSKVCNYGNFVTMAALLEKRGYNVIGGINGDYYDMASYAPLGIVITDGELKSSDAGHWAVGFREDGSAIISKPALTMSIVINGETYPIAGLNKLRDKDGFYLFTEDFSFTTKNTIAGTDVILSIPDGFKLGVNCEADLTVQEIVSSSGAMSLTEGKFVLSLSSLADDWRKAALNALTAGATVTLKISCEDDRWDGARNAVGSLYKLLTNGAVEPALNTELHPRTAVGIKTDGSIILYTVDGRQPDFSRGASMVQVANRLLELGCIEACLLDGGGSTNLSALYVGDSAVSQVNSPSGLTPRSVTNYIMLVAPMGSSTGYPARLGLYPSDVTMLAGSTYNFKIGAADSAANKTELPYGAYVSSTVGTISQDGAYTAVGTNASGKVVLSAPGLNSVSSNVNVITSPSKIIVTRQNSSSPLSSLTVGPGSKTDLSASATFNLLEVVSQDECYTWSVSGGIGTIDSNGVFTAVTKNASGAIIVTAGSTKTEIPVTVKGSPYLLADFEGSNPFTGSGVSIENDLLHVKLGSSSVRFDYSLSGGQTLICISDMKLSLSYLTLWVYGDNSGNTLYISTELDSEPVCTLDFSGWKQFTVSPKIGSDTKISFSMSGSGTGSIWLDQLIASPTTETDAEPPIISLLISDEVLTGTIRDNYDSTIASSGISVSYDGRGIDFTFNPSTGKLSAALPSSDGYAHKATVVASDLTGNMSRASLEVDATDPIQPFSDMEGHWASEYTSYLYSRSFIFGIETETGLRYNPDTPMTRADFATVIANWMGLDLTLYSDYKLDFSDSGNIPEYALPAVKAVCALGIIRGINDYGVLKFAPNEALTRAQAMTIIGRAQPRGYPESLLPFSDASLIPDWSLQYIRSLVTQGVISGYDDGTIRPGDPVTRAQVAKIVSFII